MVAGTALAALIDRPLSMLLRDPLVAIREGGCVGAECVFAGAISNIGVAVWLLTAWVCLRARRRVPEPRGRQMLLWGGLLTAALGLDDLLMLHERVLPMLLPAGEALVLSGYVAASIAFVVVSKQLLPETHVEALLAALGLLAASLVADAVLGAGYVLEDTLKASGVAAWAAFFLGTARGLTRAPPPQTKPR